MEQAALLLGSFLIAMGLFGGWFCYSKVSASDVDEASYAVGHGLMPDNSLWLIGAIVGLVTMVGGMLLVFTALVGVKYVQTWITWFQTVFG